MKFLIESTDTPRSADVKKMELLVPPPGINEYRRFFNHREVEQSQGEIDEDSGQPVPVLVPCADYVAVQNPVEPTDEEWRECLTEVGYTAEKIDLILAGE